MSTLADTFTLLNALFGMLAVASVGDPAALAFLICAVMCDGIDGFVSRRDGGEERTGVVMDSLSDSISFVLFPALFLFVSRETWGIETFLFSLTAFIYVWAGLYRLARFTVHDGLGKTFRGLPVPAAALLLSFSLSFGLRFSPPVISLLLSFLMVSSVQYPKMRGRTAIVGGIFLLFALISLCAEFSTLGYLFFSGLLLYLVSPLFIKSFISHKKHSEK